MKQFLLLLLLLPLGFTSCNKEDTDTPVINPLEKTKQLLIGHWTITSRVITFYEQGTNKELRKFTENPKDPKDYEIFTEVDFTSYVNNRPEATWSYSLTDDKHFVQKLQDGSITRTNEILELTKNKFVSISEDGIVQSGERRTTTVFRSR